MHHLKEVEGLSLKTVEVCVLDEADRLFETGSLAEQVRELLLKLPEHRQVTLNLTKKPLRHPGRTNQKAPPGAARAPAR